MDDDIPSMTPRRREVLGHLAHGLTAKEIGKRMGISWRTVEAHLNTIRKFHNLPRSYRGLATWAARAGIEPDLTHESRDEALARAVDDFQMRIVTITGDPRWRHPNLAAAAQRLEQIRDELLRWSRNQRLGKPETHENADAENTL
jgi:DNA-binding CsgD family transcriptional regulator